VNEAGAPDRAGPVTGFIGRVRSALFNSSIDSVGRGTVLAGRPFVTNDGEIRIGEDCHFSSQPVQSHMLAMQDAKITIGDRVLISYGAAISAMRAIQIGDDTRIGPFCVILDNDFHKVGDRDAPGGVAPVTIGRNVSIGTRVTVLRGARIGDGACIISGSTVSGIIANGAVVFGVPARAAKDPARKADSAVIAVIMRTFGLATLPAVSDGPAQIPGWTAIGAVRLLLALESALRVTLPEVPMRAAGTVADVVKLVAQARDQPPAART
jgi:acetyltransferase-like isoleucine patch superfamily enzyme